MDLAQAQAIAQSYDERYTRFTRQHELLSMLLAGTSMLSDMEIMRESVESAMALNEEAGWLGVESARDAFESMVKHDQQGRLVKVLGDVPAALRNEYSSMSEGEFSAHLTALRSCCRLAYDEMADLRSDLEAQLFEGALFGQLIDAVDELDWPVKEARAAEALLTNLAHQWDVYIQLGKSLVQMANEPADGDFDPTLMSALMFDK